MISRQGLKWKARSEERARTWNEKPGDTDCVDFVNSKVAAAKMILKIN